MEGLADKIKGYILILNPGKCGSSWLAHSLTIRPYISYTREFDFIFCLTSSLSEQWNKDTSEDSGFLHVRNSGLPLDKKLLSLYQMEHDKYDGNTLLIDKSPSNMYGGFEQFRHLYRDLNIVCLYRDPRDIYISNEFFQQRHLMLKDEFGEIGDLDYMKSSSSFYAAFEYSFRLLELEKTLAQESFRLVRVTYEDLIEHFNQTIWNILTFLGLDLVPETMVSSNYEITPIPLAEHIEKAFNFKPLFRKGVVGDWKNHIKDERSKTEIKRKYGDLLIKLDYERDYSW